MNLTERVLAKLGIVVASRKLDRGWCLCPFHEDHKPTNFFVRIKGERSGQWHCFACKEGGSLLDLITRKRDCSVDGAREWLDKLRGGADVEADGPAFDGVRLVVESVGRRAFTLPKEVKAGPLGEWVLPAREYARSRHLTAQQVARWGIGYATVGRLSGRLVLPVRDRHGVAFSYMARTFAGHEARYYYPREREGADLDVLFGEEFWQDVSRKQRSVVVVEGALNALAIERATGQGVTNVAALGGSAPRPVHVGKLASFGHVVILTDDDQAGDGAAWELSCQLARHTRVMRATLGQGPDGRKRDADDVTPEELRELVCGATKTS